MNIFCSRRFFFVKYLFSKSIRSLFDGGIIKLPNMKDIKARINEAATKGIKNLLKLIPLLSIAIISELFAILDVKKITEININR